MDFIRVKRLIHPVKGGSGWFGVTHNTNIYRGCNHGCIYCDSRSNCYKISNFDQIKAKENADIMIENELKTKTKKGILGMGGMNDPYNDYEKTLEYTRHALKSIDKYGFGVVLITKNTLITRDIDLYQRINTHSPVIINFTITTSLDRLQSRIEQNVSSTSERFKAIKEMSDAGLFVGITMMPILPFINDTVENITGIIEQAREAGAKFIYPSFGVTLRENQRTHFFKKIGPALTKQYVDAFGDSYMCKSPNSDVLYKEFSALCKKYGILHKMDDIITHATKNVKTEQISLF